MEFGLAQDPHVLAKNAQHALDELLDLPVAMLSTETLDQLACWAQTALTARVDTLRARLVAEADHAGVGPIQSGSRTIDQHIAARTGSNPADTRADLRLGRFLAKHAIFDHAFAKGWISRAHIELIRKAVRPRFADQLHAAQEMFVEFARTVDWTDFQKLFSYWLDNVDPDGDAPREQHESRYCNIHRRGDGTVVGRFQLDPVSGAALVHILEREQTRLLDEETAAADAGEPIERTSSQRTADALCRIAARGAERSDTVIPKPQVIVTIGQALFEDMIHSATNPDHADMALTSSFDDPERRCELLDGTPIHPHLAMQVAAVAEFRRLVLEPDGGIHDYGATTRTLPEPARTMVIAAARGRCRSPGCDAPLSWLQIDHKIPWTKTRDTSLTNSDPCCGPDNRAKGDR